MLAPAEVGGNSRWFVGTFFADNGAPGDRGFWWNPGPGGPSAASEAGDALSRISISIGVAEPGGKIYPLCRTRYIGAKRNDQYFAESAGHGLATATADKAAECFEIYLRDESARKRPGLLGAVRPVLPAAEPPASTGANWIRLLGAVRPVHQVPDHLGRREVAVTDLIDRFGDRHVDLVPERQVANGAATDHALGHLTTGRLQGRIQPDPGGQPTTEGPVARQRRRAGGDQVAETGQTRERRRCCAQFDSESGNLVQTAGDQ